ncbi:MAG: hypothetical protein EU539_08270 [Promethearchaeota archaeon]|nr:MAG: hypothetical protein EU539_08270 [Candidatus Lokiarchaeota archaeon]
MIFPIVKLNETFITGEPLMGILSVWGDLGVGKTTLALQIAIATARFKKVVFIYTKPNFSLNKIGTLLQSDQSEVLDNLNFIKSLNFLDLYELVFNFEFLNLKYLKRGANPINLLVIDSITDLYRLELNKDKKEKNILLNYQLNQMLATLNYLNEKYKTEILIINDLSRKVIDNQAIEMQGGGKVMDYWINYSLKLMRMEKLNQIKIKLTKHPNRKNLTIISTLTKDGFT